MILLGKVALVGIALVGLVGCESWNPFCAKTPKASEPKETLAVSEEMVDEDPLPTIDSKQAREAEEKYELASQLLMYAGPIDSLSAESKNVRWLAADVLQAAVELNPNEFKYYRDLFMTYMALLEPVRAIEVLESALAFPELASEAIEFQNLVFGALEYAAIIDTES